MGVCAVTLIGSPWMYVAMAKEGLFFQRVGALHPTGGVPTLALILQAGVTLIYLTFSGLSALVDTVVFVEWIFHFLVAWGLLRLRKRPEVPRPFKSPFYPLAPVIYMVAAALVVGSTITGEPFSIWGVGLGVCGAGTVAYGLWRRFVPGSAT